MITVPTDQGGCASCYAFAGATVFSWRLYIKSKGQYNVVPSFQVAMTCGSARCSEGGYTGLVFETANKGYLPSASSSPYTEKFNKLDLGFCKDKSPAADVLARLKNPSISYKTRLTDPSIDGPSNRKFTAAVRTLGEVAMMKEVFDNGPAGIDLMWPGWLNDYPENPNVCNGIQTDRTCSSSTTKAARGPDGESCVHDDEELGHAMVLIGWGEDPIGCPDQGYPGPIKYWLIQNSHGAGTGDCMGVGCGIYKFERGRNAFGLETSGVHGMTVDLDGMACKDKTDPATWCANGGSFTEDCSCYCPPEYGFTGDTCTTCDFECEGGGKAFVQPADALSGVPAMCMCTCPKGQWSPPNLRGRGIDPCAIAVGFWAGDASAITPEELQWAEDSTVQVPTAPATFNWLFSKQAGKPKARIKPFVNKGDFLVAVPTGAKPWTRETNWDANAGKANICGAKAVDQENQLINCNFQGGWGDNFDNSDRGTLTISTEGVYDVYFVKYSGVSEFGIDKGFGKNFAKLPAANARRRPHSRRRATWVD
jgi:hypothetical protein